VTVDVDANAGAETISGNLDFLQLVNLAWVRFGDALSDGSLDSFTASGTLALDVVGTAAGDGIGLLDALDRTFRVTSINQNVDFLGSHKASSEREESERGLHGSGY
jgi:hypothetical protein